MGIPRPFVDNEGKGPLGFDRPLAGDETERLIAEIENNIESEQSANTEYQKTIDMLEMRGFSDLATQVKNIQEDEIRHNREFKNILSEVRRRTDA